MLIEITKTLLEQGYRVHLYTIDKTDWSNLKEKWGVELMEIDEKSYIASKLAPRNVFSWTYSTGLYLWMLWRAQQEEGITLNNYGEVFPVISDISYVHSQPLKSFKTRNVYTLPFWNTSKKIYNKTLEYFKPQSSPTIIANSSFTAKYLKHRNNVKIVHPFVDPVKTRRYKIGTVLTVSRITEGKNLNKLIDIATACKGIIFNLAGKASKTGLTLVRRMSKHRKFRIHINPNRREPNGNL